jgi:hypothetical protein
LLQFLNQATTSLTTTSSSGPGTISFQTVDLTRFDTIFTLTTPSQPTTTPVILTKRGTSEPTGNALIVPFKTLELYVSESNLTVECKMRRLSPFDTGGWDNFSLLYGTSFNSTAPLGGLLVANDDLGDPASFVTGFSTSHFGANQQLVFVLTGFNSNEFGISTCTFMSSGAITLGKSPLATSFGQPCFPAVASEQAVLDASSLSCCSSGVLCEMVTSSSPCQVTALPFIYIPLPSLSSIVLSELHTVTGGVKLGTNDVASLVIQISFPKLVDVGWIELLSLRNLIAVNLASLKRTTIDHVFFINLTAMFSLYMPALASINGSFYFYNNALTSLYMPVVTLVNGNFEVGSNDALASLSMPVLASVNGYL